MQPQADGLPEVFFLAHVHSKPSSQTWDCGLVPLALRGEAEHCAARAARVPEDLREAACEPLNEENDATPTGGRLGQHEPDARPLLGEGGHMASTIDPRSVKPVPLSALFGSGVRWETQG